MLQSRKTSVYCSFRFTATKSNTNMLEPQETKPESASNPLQHKQPPQYIHTVTTAVLYFLWKQVAAREHEWCVWMCVCLYQCRYSRYPDAHACNVCAIPRPAIWLDPQRGSASVTFTFRWRFSLSAVPCCSWCSNVGRHGWLPGPLIHTPGGKLLSPTDSTICLSNCSLSLSNSLCLSPFVWFPSPFQTT